MSCQRSRSHVSCRSNCHDDQDPHIPIPPIDDLNFMQHWYPDCDTTHHDNHPCPLSMQYAKEAAYKTNGNRDFVRKSLKVSHNPSSGKKFCSEYNTTYSDFSNCYDKDKEKMANLLLYHVVELYDEIEEMREHGRIKVCRFENLKCLESLINCGKEKILDDLCFLECKFEEVRHKCFGWTQKGIDKIVRKSRFVPANIAGLALKLLHHLEKFSICQCTQCDLDQYIHSVMKVLKYLCCELSDFCDCLRKKSCCEESSSESEVEIVIEKKSVRKIVSSSSSDDY